MVFHGNDIMTKLILIKTVIPCWHLGSNFESGGQQAEWHYTFELQLGRKLVSFVPLLQGHVLDTLISCVLDTYSSFPPCTLS